MSSVNVANIRKTIYYLRRNGIKNTWYAARERLEDRQESAYTLQKAHLSELEEEKKWSEDKELLFSIVVPTYRTKEQYLRDMTDSVIAQSYPHWELIIADATENDSVKDIISTYNDDRIKFIQLGDNRGISENTNRGINAAKGDYIGLLDHDDFIEPELLYNAAKAIYEYKKEHDGAELKMLYSDEDKCDSDRTKYYEPHYKEDFNLDLLLSNNYVCHFLLLEKNLMKNLLLRKEYDGAQDYDLVLRAVSKLEDSTGQIYHIPKVLYHWRCHAASTAQNPKSKLYAYEAGKRALQDFADRKQLDADAVDLKHVGFYRLDYRKDIFEARQDIGAAGGAVICGGRIAGGRMDRKGAVYYQGLREGYSGYMHRAALTQDAEALDIRCIKLNQKLWETFENVTGISYREDASGMFDITLLSQKTDNDIKELGLKLSEAVREKGYRLIYMPEDCHRYIKGIKSSRQTPRSGRMNGTATQKEQGKTKITVVIPNYNGEKYLKGCLDSLLCEKSVKGTPDFKIIVVDNGSAGADREILSTYGDKITTIMLNKNTGFCHAVNVGIKASDTPYVILLNNDTKVKSGFILNLYRAIIRNNKIFAVSAKMLMWDRPELIDDAGDYYCALGWAFARGKGEPAYRYNKRKKVFSACGGAAIYKKNIFDEIGLFDERHFAYLEDLDIGYRAAIKGYLNYYEPSAEVLHYGSASTGSRYNNIKTELAAANNVYVIAKNMPVLQILLNLPFLLVGFVIKFIFFSRKGMGGLYVKGLCKGLKKSFDSDGRKHKIPFKISCLPHYIVLQAELYLNILRRFIKKS
jgi:GT2 family glycosyltransferase